MSRRSCEKSKKQKPAFTEITHPTTHFPMASACYYHILTNDRIYTYTSADLAKGVAAAYLLDDEPMSGPQRRLRIRVQRLYARALSLLAKANARGQSWARDFARDARMKYESLDRALESADMVNLREAIEIMTELLGDFAPGREINGRRVFERNRGRRRQMEAERDLLLGELQDITIAL